MFIIGTVMNLTAGTATLTIPAGTRYVFVQAQDTASMQITAPGYTGGPVLNPGLNAVAGVAGDWIDSIGFPFLLNVASITLTSTVATAQFAAWATIISPLNVYPVPEQIIR